MCGIDSWMVEGGWVDIIVASDDKKIILVSLVVFVEISSSFPVNAE